MSVVQLRLTRPIAGIRAERACPPAVAPGPTGAVVLDPFGELEQDAVLCHEAVRSLTEHIALTVQQVEGLVRSRLDELGRYAVELGLGLAERLVEHEIERGHMDPTPHVAECLHKAVQGVVQGSIVVRLNPADLSHVLSEIDRLEAPELRHEAVRYAVDPGIGRGACRVETSIGRIVHDPRTVLREALERVREEAGLDLA